jgi:ACS family tartrate transporter-like MFS transporter
MSTDLERSTLRAVTWRLTPLLLLAYFISYVDRINIGFAGAALNADVGLSKTVFGFGAGLFFIAYFLFEVPSNLLLEKFGARRWIARIMLSWGVVSVGMMFVQGPYSFYALRFLLGVAEAGFFPGVIYYLVCWFPARYRARQMTLFTLGIPLSTVFGAPLSGLLLNMSGIGGLAGWQWMFLLEGLPAVFVALLIFRMLPDRPRDAAWLAPEQKQWLETTLAAEPDRPRRSHLGTTLKSFYDPRVLALCVIYLANTSANYSLAFFLPQIIATTGTTNTQTGLLTAIPAVTGVFGLLLIGWLSHRFSFNRGMLIAALLITSLGLFSAAHFGAAGASTFGIAALAFAGIGIHGLKAPFWALAPTALAGSAAAGGIAWINSVGNLGGFAGPYFMGWATDTFGAYRAGIYVLAALQLLAVVLVLLIAREPGATQSPLAEPARKSKSQPSGA